MYFLYALMVIPHHHPPPWKTLHGVTLFSKHLLSENVWKNLLHAFRHMRKTNSTGVDGGLSRVFYEKSSEIVQCTCCLYTHKNKIWGTPLKCKHIVWFWDLRMLILHANAQMLLPSLNFVYIFHWPFDHVTLLVGPHKYI